MTEWTVWGAVLLTWFGAAVQLWFWIRNQQLLRECRELLDHVELTHASVHHYIDSRRTAE